MSEIVATDSAQVETTSATPDSASQEQTPSNEPSWFLDDSTPGQGPRPDWLPSKYKKVSDLAKSYSEAEKRLGGFTGAPEAYDLASLELDGEQHLVKELTAVAKELNMSQEGLNKFLGRFTSAHETESQMHLDEQVKKLGKDGERMLTEFNNWSKDHLQAEEQEVIKDWVRSAEDLQVFNKLMAHTHMSKVPTGQTMSMANHFESVQELRNEMVKNIERYNKDAAYRKDYSSRLERAVSREKR